MKRIFHDGQAAERTRTLFVVSESMHSHILLQHSLGIEEGTVHGDGMPHDLHKAIVIILEWNQG
ncbi:MAG: hypothetical protein DMG78_18535 [Acidobacteria bacterium]|nr:MAG: hypothetical protein DMG78_18535 [Acidobacteriota bacterium]